MESIEEKIVEGVKVIEKYWPWLDHFHRHPQTGAYAWSGSEPVSQISFKVTAMERLGSGGGGKATAPKLFDWELYALCLSWDANDRILQERRKFDDAMDIDAIEDAAAPVAVVVVDEEAFKYKRIPTNRRLFPEQGFPGQTVWEVLQEECIPSKETLEMFENILIALHYEDDYREFVLRSPNVWAMALEWHENQRLIFTIEFPARVEIQDRFKTLLLNNTQPERGEDELKHEAATPLWKLILHPDIVFFEARTWREEIIWQRLDQHAAAFVSPIIPDENLDQTMTDAS